MKKKEKSNPLLETQWKHLIPNNDFIQDRKLKTFALPAAKERPDLRGHSLSAKAPVLIACLRYDFAQRNWGRPEDRRAVGLGPAVIIARSTKRGIKQHPRAVIDSVMPCFKKMKVIGNSDKWNVSDVCLLELIFQGSFCLVE